MFRVFRPLTINPWIRREIHIHHHKVSGTPTDIEERGVSNGEKWGLIRLVTMADIFLAGAWRSYRIKKDMNTLELKKLFFLKVKYFGMLPFTFVCYLILYSYSYLFIILFGQSFCCYFFASKCFKNVLSALYYF